MQPNKPARGHSRIQGKVGIAVELPVIRITAPGTEERHLPARGFLTLIPTAETPTQREVRSSVAGHWLGSIMQS